MSFALTRGLFYRYRLPLYYPLWRSLIARTMAYEASLSKLPHPLKDLVANAQADTGRTDADKLEVVSWLDRVAAGDVVSPESFSDLDTLLVPRTYIVSNYFTAADVALYGALHPTLFKSQLQPAQYYATPAITRYFDYIQTLPSVRAAVKGLSPAFSIVPFDFESAPKIERKQQPPKKKEKILKTVDHPETEKKSEIAANSQESASEPPKKEVKKEKKKDAIGEDGSKENKGRTVAGGKAPAEDAGEPVPSMIDLRVGHIIDVKKHPDADSLYIEQIDLGEETGPRTVVSGLVNYIPIEEMHDKYLVAICNLKPAAMRGVKSFAMVLAATSKDGKEGGVELIQPPPGSKPGERVYFEGPMYEDAQPVSQLNPKKKIFETIQPGFTTLGTREAAWINPVTKSIHKIRTKNGVCVAPTFVGASLS